MDARQLKRHLLSLLRLLVLAHKPGVMQRLVDDKGNNHVQHAKGEDHDETDNEEEEDWLFLHDGPSDLFPTFERHELEERVHRLSHRAEAVVHRDAVDGDVLQGAVAANYVRCEDGVDHEAEHHDGQQEGHRLHCVPKRHENHIESAKQPHQLHQAHQSNQADNPKRHQDVQVTQVFVDKREDPDINDGNYQDGNVGPVPERVPPCVPFPVDPHQDLKQEDQDEERVYDDPANLVLDFPA
mmetsp:Transcript_96875/g.224558  ORF Transcript_96875/g.224558 Transcript_96875/m.224558 type:complete len:240 (-) Transcript_96875:531-1250(-)